jgi:hypothetical protein
MVALLIRAERAFLILCALGLAGLIVWWAALTYSHWSTRLLLEQVHAVASERDDAMAVNQRLQETARKVVELEQKLALARAEPSENVELAASKQVALVPDIPTLHMNDSEQKTDGVPVTGSIRQPKKRKAAGG